MGSDAIRAPRTSRLVVTARSLLLPYLVGLALVVFLPARDAGQVTGIVGWAADQLALLGVPREPAAVVLEFLANVVLFMPFGALVAIAFPGTRWLAVLVAGCLVSIGIELTQLAIPSRVATASDVIANTAGTGVGLLLVRIRRPRSE